MIGPTDVTMHRVFNFLRYSDLPLMTRPNYLAELRQITLWGIVAGAIEADTVSVVASKTFHASDLLTTIIWSLPVLMNVLNVVWGSLLRGRRRKQAFILVALCGLGSMGSIGFTSADWQPWGGWMFALQIACTHLFASGLITLRTTMWKANYPTACRARIASRLQTPRVLCSILVVVGLGRLYDHQPDAYRVMYPAIAVIGALSLLMLRRFRMRGEQAELRAYREHAGLDGAAGQRLTLWAGLLEAGRILRTDRPYARYQIAQFLLGAANFFTGPILVLALTKDMEFDYFNALILLHTVPYVALLLSMQLWAPLFDRVGVLRFRVVNSACWLGSYVAVAIALLLMATGPSWIIEPGWMPIVVLPLLAIGRLLHGIGRGGGAIAWNIGHLRFAGAHQTELYMGIHVGLTGLRALLMPLLGQAAFAVMGYWALLIAVGLAAASHILFRRLADNDAAMQTPSDT